MPKYTGDLTVKQAVANFNDYNNFYEKYPYIELMPDGIYDAVKDVTVKITWDGGTQEEVCKLAI